MKKNNNILKPTYTDGSDGHHLMKMDAFGKPKAICQVCGKECNCQEKKECDHIVGYWVSASSHLDLSASIDIETIRISKGTHFNCNIECACCPECGEKINLQQSKEEPTEAVMFNLGGKKKPKEEKKECEHKICIKYPLQKNIPLDKVDFFLYCCTNPKCGLVTCIDPNK